MKLAVITKPTFFVEEDKIITRLFDEGLDFLARQLGGPKELSRDQVERLYDIRRQFGVKGKHPAVK